MYSLEASRKPTTDLVRDNTLGILNKFKTSNVAALFNMSGAKKSGYSKRTFIMFLFKLKNEGLIKLLSDKNSVEMYFMILKSFKEVSFDKIIYQLSLKLAS